MIKFSLIICFMLVATQCFSQTKKLFLVAGQSNCVGKGDSSLSVNCDSLTNFEYQAKNNELIPLQDPVGEDYLNFQQAHYGSAWPSFAQHYHQITKDTIVIVPAARDGSSCNVKAELKSDGTWDRQGEILLFDNAVMKAKKAEQITDVPLSGIIWVQGERDANAINNGNLTVAEYERSLQDLLNRFRQELGGSVPFYIIQTGAYVGHPEEGFQKVRKAQTQLAKNNKLVFVAYKKAKQFPSLNWMRSDGIHYTQAAYNDIGRNLALYITKQTSEK